MLNCQDCGPGKSKKMDSRYILTLAECGLPGFMLLVLALGLGCRGALAACIAAGDQRLRAVYAGCFGIVLAAALGGVFTDFLVRGLVLPLVFAMSVTRPDAVEKDGPL